MNKTCAVMNCLSIPRYGTICEKHIYRMKKFGSYEKPSKRIYNDNCRVEGCVNLRDGRHSVCGKHRSRLSRYKSTDLPTFNYPESIIHECKIHGFLREQQAYKNPKYGHYSCIQCRRNTDKKFCKDNPNKQEEYKKHFYIKDTNIRLNKNMHELLFNEQNGLCAICKKPETRKNPQKNAKSPTKRLSIDHKHGTDKIRGLLCQLCNTGLGVFKDSIETLQAAIDYLKHNQKDDLNGVIHVR